MRKLIYILILVVLPLGIQAQNKLSNAMYSLKHNELEKAKVLIDAASEDSLFSNRAATWYYKGYIYKEIFLKSERDNRQSPARDTAVASFLKALDKEDADQFVSSINSSLRHLAGTYYNQAAKMFDTENYPFALLNYERFKEIMILVDPNYDFKSLDINFQLALATVYNEIAAGTNETSELYSEKAAKLYEHILTQDTTNISANYNLGIYYYNQGVELVNNMDYSMDLYELNAIQDSMIHLFRMSLPYMKKAYDLDPTRKETLEGLQGIYFSLNDRQKADLYKNELKALEEEEPSDQPLEDKNEEDK